MVVPHPLNSANMMASPVAQTSGCVVFLLVLLKSKPQSKAHRLKSEPCSAGLQVEPAPVSGGLQVEPAPVSGGLQVEPAPVNPRDAAWLLRRPQKELPQTRAARACRSPIAQPSALRERSLRDCAPYGAT